MNAMETGELHPGEHAPTGFEWGYGGSGPSQLALALLLDATATIRQWIVDKLKRNKTA